MINITISYYSNMAASVFVEKGIPPDPKARSADSEAPVLPLQKHRILVADDHAIFRECLIRLLQDYPGFDVVGDAENGQKAVELAELLQPDIVIMDVDMPFISGIEATRLIAAKLPHIRIIGLSMHDGKEMASQILSAGAKSYFVKDGPIENLLEAILA
jgi:DNA-binding NarL/FixJ family response regulator